jgi:hypothetical protein
MRQIFATRNRLKLLVLGALCPVLAACTAPDFLTRVEQLVDASPESGFNSSKAITAFNFTTPAATGVVVEASHTVAVTVPSGTSITALVPSIITTGPMVSPAPGVAQNFTNPVVYTVKAADSSTQAYTVTVTVAPSNSKAITAFNFTSLGATGVVTEATHTVAITVPFGTPVTALVPAIAIAGSSISPPSGASQDFTNPVMYTVTAGDSSTQAYVVTVTVALSPNKDITSFSIVSPAATGTIVGTAINVTVPFGTSVTSLVASFTTTGTSVKVGAAIQTSVITANDFTSPVIYTVTADDSTMKNYTVTITVAPSPNKDITTFSIVSPAATGTIVGTAINVTVPFGTNALVASFTTTGASVKVGAITQISGVTVNDFASPVTYTVTAADSSAKNYTVTVTVLPLAFNYTGSQQNWIAPAGVTRIRVTATGAAGGLGAVAAGGAGGQMIADINVIPGNTYYIFVGGKGGPGGIGWNGGGIDGHVNTCTYGGGATDIRYGGIGLTNRILVVGGGGGVGANGGGLCGGGYGAGTFNANGGPGQTMPTESTGGGGGTQSAGGAGGNGNFGISPAASGGLGVGSSNTDYGGAGGGGYYGGGSGGSGFAGSHSGGGGGSSYLDVSYGTYVSGTDGFNPAADGSVVVENVSP